MGGTKSGVGGGAKSGIGGCGCMGRANLKWVGVVVWGGARPELLEVWLN